MFSFGLVGHAIAPRVMLKIGIWQSQPLTNVRLKLSARWRLGGKAAEDCRSPKPVGYSWQPIIAIASWTAAVLCRFSFAYQSLPGGFNRTRQKEGGRGRIMVAPPGSER